MPFSLDPDAIAPVFLESDNAKPEAERPAFLMRFLTCRQLQRWQELRNQAREEKDDAKCVRLLLDCLAVGLTGWRNMGERSFAIDVIPELLTVEELWELVEAAPTRIRLSEADRRGFLSPSRSAGANSATTTTATAAPVPSEKPAP